MLPVAFDATEKRTRDYVRHGTTNLFAALNVDNGQVYGECKPTRNGADFLAFLRRAVKPHVRTDVHVVLDNLSTHTTPEVAAWLQNNPHVQPFTFRIQVSHQTQECSSEFLPTSSGIRQGASRRTR